MQFQDLVPTSIEDLDDILIETQLKEESKEKQTDDFGQVITDKQYSPLESNDSIKEIKKINNPNQTLQGFLSKQKSDKALAKAKTLYNAWLRYCIQNKIDPNIFLTKGVKK